MGCRRGLPKGRGRGRAELVSARCLSAGLGRGLVQTFVWTLCRSVVSMRDLFHFVWPHAAVGLTTFVSLLLCRCLSWEYDSSEGSAIDPPHPSAGYRGSGNCSLHCVFMFSSHPRAPWPRRAHPRTRPPPQRPAPSGFELVALCPPWAKGTSPGEISYI